MAISVTVNRRTNGARGTTLIPQPNCWDCLESTDQDFAFVRHCTGGIELCIEVVLCARRPQISGVLGNRLKVRICAPPEKGKSNQALLLLIADWLETKTVGLVAGCGRAEKTVRILGIHELSNKQMRSFSEFFTSIG